jgi:hypothetical protein
MGTKQKQHEEDEPDWRDTYDACGMLSSSSSIVKVTQIDPFLKLEYKMNRICKKFTI